MNDRIDPLWFTSLHKRGCKVMVHNLNMLDAFMNIILLGSLRRKAVRSWCSLNMLDAFMSIILLGSLRKKAVRSWCIVLTCWMPS